MFTKVDLYNPLVIVLKFPDQILIKFKICLNDAYSSLNSEIIWRILKYLNLQIFYTSQLQAEFFMPKKI